jgi:hypothetical protein
MGLGYICIYGACALHAGTQGYKYTHSLCIVFIAFPPRQLLQECATILHYTHIACLVLSCLLHISIDLVLANIWLLICSVNITYDESSYSSWILICVFMFMSIILIIFFLSHILWHTWEFCRLFRWYRATLYVRQVLTISVTYHKYVGHVIVMKTVNQS